MLLTVANTNAKSVSVKPSGMGAAMVLPLTLMLQRQAKDWKADDTEAVNNGRRCQSESLPRLLLWARKPEVGVRVLGL